MQRQYIKMTIGHFVHSTFSWLEPVAEQPAETPRNTKNTLGISQYAFLSVLVNLCDPLWSKCCPNSPHFGKNSFLQCSWHASLRIHWLVSSLRQRAAEWEANTKSFYLVCCFFFYSFNKKIPRGNFIGELNCIDFNTFWLPQTRL